MSAQILESESKSLFRYTLNDGFSFFEAKSELDEEEHFIEGYISTKSLDLVNDIVTDECMQDMLIQIKSGSVKLDWDHETILDENLDKIPRGRIVDARMDMKGLWVKCLINKFHPEFKSIWGSIKTGMIDAFSIGYKAITKATKYIQGKAVRLLQKLTLINVALTGTPVNQDCKMTDIIGKSLDFLEEQEIKSNLSTSLSGDNNKMEEEKKLSEEEEEAKKKKAEAEAKSEEAEGSEKDKKEDEDEEEKKKGKEEMKALTATVEAMKAEIKSLKEKNLNFEKELVKPEFKALSQSSPESIKQIDKKSTISPLGLFA